MLGIVEGALKQHQEIKVDQHEYKSPAWAKSSVIKDSTA